MGRPDTARENGKLGGRPPGRLNNETLRRVEVLKALQQRIMAAADLLIDSQMSLARGQQFLYKIEKYWLKKKGRKILVRKPPKLVTDPEEIRAYIQRQLPESDIDDDKSPTATYYFITTKSPDNKAIEGLKHTAFGKAVQPVALTDPEGDDLFDNESKEKANQTIGEFLGRRTNSRARRAKRN